MKKHGTPFELGQYNEVLCAIIKALPKAVVGIDPKELLSAIKGRGEDLEKMLGEMFAGFIKAAKIALELAEPALIFSHRLADGLLKIVEDVGAPQEIAVKDLELVAYNEVCKIGKEALGGGFHVTVPSISWEELQRAAAELGANMGYRCAEYLLKHGEEIPEEFGKYELLFPGTVWEDEKRNVCITVLKRNSFSKQWGVMFSQVRINWYSDEGHETSGAPLRLLRLHKHE